MTHRPPPPPPPPPPPAPPSAAPPPPDGPPPAGVPGRVAGSQASPAEVRSRTRRRLDQVPAPYALWVGLLSVAIFCAPNLLTLLAPPGAGSGAPVVMTDTELVVGLVLTIVLQLVVFTLALLPLLAAGRPFSRLWGPTKGTPAMIAIGVGVGVAVVIITYTVNLIAVLLFGDGDPVEQDLLDYALSGGVITVLAIFIAVILAPVVEEIVFRGILFRALSARTGVVLGTLVSAAIFAGIHLEVVFSQPLALVGLFMVGALLAIAYHYTGSIVVPIIGHAVFNATSLGLARLVDQLDPLPLETMLEVVGAVAGTR